MNKNAIKKFAVNARRELIARVSQKALQYGISEKEIGNKNDDIVDGHLLSTVEKKQRAALIDQINIKGYQQVLEEVAYTWFNRFSALRFMEVNGYLPSRVRVFTDENNEFKPQILTEAIHMDLEGLDMEKVYAHKEANNNDELYKYLLITQCNALNAVLPGMFQKISDYTELLFPDNLLREGSVVQQMIELIPEEDWQDAVQIIGWLYQYYNSEKKDDVFAALKKNVKITKENIPAATQLFTPDWIVRYMVENSLGRLWVEGHPDAQLQATWKYYLEEAEQEPDVKAQLAEIRKEYAGLKPEDILCIDPCSGSGHILAYMFDVLVQIYEAYGVDTRTAVASIVENNLYGLDIDERAAQLAYFSVMMKACQYDRRFLRRGVQPHVHAIVESNHIDAHILDYFCDGDTKLQKALEIIVQELHDAKEYGSIITVTPQDWDALYARFAEIEEKASLFFTASDAVELKKLVQVAEALSKKYHAVVTNPPYMGASNMNPQLNDFIKDKYADYKADFFSAFMVHCAEMTTRNGKLGFFTPYVWMFIQSYEKLREFLCRNKTIETLIQFEYSAFEEATVPVCTLAFSNYHIDKKSGYFRLTEFRGGMEVQRQKTLEAIADHGCGYYYEAKTSNFSKIPGSPVAYWVSDRIPNIFKNNKCMAEIAKPRKGLASMDNQRFYRLWFEISIDNFNQNAYDKYEAVLSGRKWFPLSKGGEYRKWYGNREYVINWYNDGKEMKDNIVRIYKGGSYTKEIRSENLYFKPLICWSGISSYKPSFRKIEKGFLFDSSGPAMYVDTDNEYILSFLNSSVASYILSILNQTLSFLAGDIAKLPVIVESKKVLIDDVSKENISLSKNDWDSFETSWDFLRHPLIPTPASKPQANILANTQGTTYIPCPLEAAYLDWMTECEERFNQLKANEEELNRIFIDIYGLQDELTPEVADKDVTVRKADLNRDIKSFISYAVGCMFGRYSLDVEGLAYAGGEWDKSKYTSFAADADNIIPICDDEYFDDDVVGRFVKFVEVVYGAETLQENLKFIADALGGSGQPKEVIRNYFMKEFFADHCKIYQKRPIYWLFDSGKKNGFKCLIYMHRYQPDTIARIRTDYVHEQQARYRTAIADLEHRLANATTTSERVKLNKKLKTVNEQAAEIHEYEEKIHHLADQMLSIDLDDGVKKNYELFKDVLAKIK